MERRLKRILLLTVLFQWLLIIGLAILSLSAMEENVKQNFAIEANKKIITDFQNRLRLETNRPD